MPLAKHVHAAELPRTVRTGRVVLSPEDRRAREAAVRFANASVGLEGVWVSPEAEERARRFIDSEMDLAEFLQRP